jgi:hypothetical protein
MEMTVKISVVGPVLNEVQFIGYSVMAAMPYVHEFIYALDEKSDDGTRELLLYIQKKYLHERLTILDHPTFHPSDIKAYNGAFNRCIEKMTGDAAFFLHPDMIITKGPENGIPEHALAWFTNMTSYARDFKTIITKGRCNQWKNIHRKRFGLHYYGAYGSQNEDFYHRDITGRSYKHYGPEFSKYPFQTVDSGISINHYCELKDYSRRFEKMKFCLKTLYPEFTDERIKDMATQHPRVTLEESSSQFGKFEFKELEGSIPDVFETYKEFEEFRRELVHA